MITVRTLKKFIEGMDDETQCGLSYDELEGEDVLTFQEPGSNGGETILEIGRIEPVDSNEPHDHEQD